MKLAIVMLLVLPALAGNAWAHGGGLNKDGCHNDRKNGGYHCHRGSAPAPVEQRYQPSDQPAPRYQPSPARPQGGRAFANCAEARAAGAAPVRRGDAGYGRIWIGMAMGLGVSRTGDVRPVCKRRVASTH